MYHTETGCEIADPTRPAEVCEHAYELVYCIFYCVLSTLSTNTINKANKSKLSQPYFIRPFWYTFRPTQPFSEGPLAMEPGSVKIYISAKCIYGVGILIVATIYL